MNTAELARSFQPGERVYYISENKIVLGTVYGPGASVGSVTVVPDKFSKNAVMYPSVGANELSRIPR